MKDPADRPETARPPAAARRNDPAPRPGLGLKRFRRICANGFGDGHNSFAHSMVAYKDRVLVGTTRSNFQMVKIQRIFENLPVPMWPVEGPDDADGLYELDRRAQIWSYDPSCATWERKMVAPIVSGKNDQQVARETGYRSMVVYKGQADSEDSLYVATWAVSRSPGALILRSNDGDAFETVTDYGIIRGLPVTATRLLVPFRDKLYTSPTGSRGLDVKFKINVSGMPIIFETDDPTTGEWRAICEPGFGNPANEGVFILCAFNDQLYAGTFNCEGFEVWRSACHGEPPYEWVKVIDQGAHRGPLNQIAATMVVFNGALYVGTGIQNGGFDRVNNIGPAGAEIIRIWPDDSWDLLVGTRRDTPEGHKLALSGVAPGFGNLFNGYLWAMSEHDGWLYAGTMDSTIWVKYLLLDAYPEHARKLVTGVGVDNIIANEAGCDLWRTADGENWLPITRTGFDNPYNLGVRNLVSTPHGLFVAIANPFGPRVAEQVDGEWTYVDNERGGLEVWLGTFDKDAPAGPDDVSMKIKGE